MSTPFTTVEVPDVETFLLQLGSAGENDIVIAGVIVFGLVGACCLYLYYYQSEMKAGTIVRNIGYACLLLAVLSLIWPWRPWPA